MTHFDDAWVRGLKRAARTLKVKDPSAAAVAKRLRGVCFPAALGLLANPKAIGEKKGGVFIAAAAKRAARERALQRAGLDAEAIEDIFAAILVDRRVPAEVLGNEKALTVLLRAALASQGIEASPKEVRDIQALLASGEFFGDVVDVTGAVFRVLPRLPRAILKDIPEMPSLPGTLVGGLFGDLGALLGGLRTIVDDIGEDGRLDVTPQVLNRTLTTLYGVATVDTTRSLIRELIDPKNRSVRLAIVLYARANGIPIKEKHLDVLRDSVLSSRDPDFGPALAVAAKALATRYEAPELEEMLDGMGTIKN